MKKIVENILQRTAQLCPSLQYVKKDQGQLYAETFPGQWPCALVDVSEVNYALLRDGTRTADAYLSVTVADLEAESQETSGLRVFDLLTELARELQGWPPETDCSGMNLRSVKRLRLEQAGYEVYRMEFQVKFREKM